MTAEAAAADAQPEMATFRPVRSELTIKVNFATPFWPLTNDTAAVYPALLSKLQSVGVGPNDLRTDVGDGYLGGFNINFWVNQIKALVRLRLENFEIHTRNLSDIDADVLELTFLSVCRALAPDEGFLPAKNFEVSVAMHGDAEGVAAPVHLSRFVKNVPSTLGPSVGSGVIFYFGESSPRLFSSISSDLSAVYPGSLFVKAHVVFDGAFDQMQLRKATTDYLNSSLNAIGLVLATSNEQG